MTRYAYNDHSPAARAYREGARDEANLTRAARSPAGNTLVDCIDTLTATPPAASHTGQLHTAPPHDIAAWLTVVFTTGTPLTYRARLAWRILRNTP